MGPYRQTFRHALPTAATLLAGVVRRHRDHSPASPCCLACEDGAELAPTGIADALGEMGIAHHVADLQIFQIDGVIVTEQLQRGLVLKVARCR